MMVDFNICVYDIKAIYQHYFNKNGITDPSTADIFDCPELCVLVYQTRRLGPNKLVLM